MSATAPEARGEGTALREAWAINARITRYLLDAVPAAGLGARAGGKGRSVAEHFAHLNNVRLMWLQSAAPELHAGLAKVEKERAEDLPALGAALDASAAAVGELLERAAREGGRVKGFKPHASAFLAYLAAHEGHHRGQVVQVLKLAGTPVDKKVAYGLWEWGVR